MILLKKFIFFQQRDLKTNVSKVIRTKSDFNINEKCMNKSAYENNINTNHVTENSALLSQE